MKENMPPNKEINQEKLTAKKRLKEKWLEFQEETDLEKPKTTLRTIFLAELADDGSSVLEEEVRNQVEANSKKIKESTKLTEVADLIILNNVLKSRLMEMRPEPKKEITPQESIEISFRDISPRREIFFHD